VRALLELHARRGRRLELAHRLRALRPGGPHHPGHSAAHMTLRDSFRVRRGHFVLAAIVLVVDQATKIGVDLWLPRGEPVRIIPGFLNLWYSRNRGGLFGTFSDLADPWRAILLTLFPLLAIALIGWFLLRAEEQHGSTLAGLGLILGGATGNLVDRVARGEVVDFLDAYASWEPLAARLYDRFGTVHWPTFNVADSAIVVGACLLALDIFRPERSRAEVGSAPAAEDAAANKTPEVRQ
jgi:signal peptidase II